VLRRSERVLVGYFSYAAVVAQFLAHRPHVAAITLGLNALIIFGYLLLAYADSLRRRMPLGVIRDWFPFPLVLMAYREMGWLAPAQHTYNLERQWVVWDRVLLNGWGLHRAIECCGALFPSILEIAYALVYAIPPFAMAMLYAYRHRERADRFLFTALLGVLLSYALFPYFMSEPPRTVFPGDLFPSAITIVRRFNWALLGGYGIHTSVFPSAHVSASLSVALAMRSLLPEHKWVGRLLMALAILIALAVVYGRYHYAADVAAGVAVALVAFRISWRSLKAR